MHTHDIKVYGSRKEGKLSNLEKDYQPTFKLSYESPFYGSVTETISRDEGIELILEAARYTDIDIPENLTGKPIERTQWVTTIDSDYDGNKDTEKYTQKVYYSSSKTMKRKIAGAPNRELAAVLKLIYPFIDYAREKTSYIPADLKERRVNYHVKHKAQRISIADIKKHPVQKLKPVIGQFPFFIKDIISCDKIQCPACGDLHHENVKRCNCGWRNPSPITHFTHLPLRDWTVKQLQNYQAIDEHIDDRPGILAQIRTKRGKGIPGAQTLTLASDAGENCAKFGNIKGESFFEMLVLNSGKEY